MLHVLYRGFVRGAASGTIFVFAMQVMICHVFCAIQLLALLRVMPVIMLFRYDAASGTVWLYCTNLPSTGHTVRVCTSF